jgi:hypothetical protein
MLPGASRTLYPGRAIYDAERGDFRTQKRLQNIYFL